MAAPSISPLPTPPSRSQSPTTFSADADAFLGALPTFQSEANAQADYLDGLAVDVTADANAAAASATAAANSATIAAAVADYQGAYNPATTYQIGQSVSYNGSLFVANTVNTGVEPVDGANWYLIENGDVVGPASATDGGLVAFDGTSGTLIKAAGTVTAAQGGTGLTSAGTAGNLLTSDGTNWISAAPPASGVNYPQNIQSADYTLVLDDAGKMIFHPASDNAIRTYTIPSNASVAFPIGTVVLFTADILSKPLNIGINSDSLVFGDGTTGGISIVGGNTLMAIKVTATKWFANYLYQSGSPLPRFESEALAVAHLSSPFVTVYPWSTSGFGTKFADPATLPENNGNGVSFHPSGNAIAVANNGTQGITAYPWSVFGFGTKYANPATAMPTGTAIAFSPAGNAIASVSSGFPVVHAYPWSTSGFGTKYANPSFGIGNVSGFGVAFSPSSNAIAVGTNSAPFIHAYSWSTSGFGTKFADPATTLPNAVFGVAFSPAGNAIALAHASSPFFSAYSWSASGFGTKFANPATLPAGGTSGESVAFSPAGDAIVFGHNGSPRIFAYSWSTSGFGTKFADPATIPTGTVEGVAFSPTGNAIAAAHASSPFITAYPWSASGFGTKFANPATLPPNNGNSVAFTLSA